jgi:hypothetical protein
MMESFFFTLHKIEISERERTRDRESKEKKMTRPISTNLSKMCCGSSNGYAGCV